MLLLRCFPDAWRYLKIPEKLSVIAVIHIFDMSLENIMVTAGNIDEWTEPLSFRASLRRAASTVSPQQDTNANDLYPL